MNGDIYGQNEKRLINSNTLKQKNRKQLVLKLVSI